LWVVGRRMLRLTPVLPQMASHCWLFCLAWVLRDRHNQIRSRFLATDSGQGSVEQHNKTLLWLSVVRCVMVLCAQCEVSCLWFSPPVDGTTFLAVAFKGRWRPVLRARPSPCFFMPSSNLESLPPGGRNQFHTALTLRWWAEGVGQRPTVWV
jgi:hypothetical protein